MTQAVRELLVLSDGWALLGPAPLLRVQAGQEGGPEQEERHGAVAEGRCLVLGLEKNNNKNAGRENFNRHGRSKQRTKKRKRTGRGRGGGGGGESPLSLSRPERLLPSEKPQDRKTSNDMEDGGR